MAYSTRPSRVTGTIMLVFGLLNCLGTMPFLLRDDLMAGAALGKTMATIIEVTPSRDNSFPSPHVGTRHRYQFNVGDDRYQGSFFRRQDWMNVYAVGKTVEVQ